MFEIRTKDVTKGKVVAVKIVYYLDHALSYANLLEKDYIRDPSLEVEIVNTESKEVVDH